VSKHKSLPLDSPNWVPILDAHRAILPRTGNWYLAARDLTEKLRSGDIRSMRRRVYGEGADRELLTRSFWRAHELLPINISRSQSLTRTELASRPGPSPPDTVWVFPLGGSAIREYAFFIWKPDLDKILSTEAAAKRARRKGRPRKRHADKVTASPTPAPPSSPPSTGDKPKRRGSREQRTIREWADGNWPGGHQHIELRDIIFAAKHDKEFSKKFPGDAFPERTKFARALDRRDD